MRLLVTGAGGFVGRTLTGLFGDRDSRIAPVTLARGVDVSNRQALIDAVGRLSIDAVIHLAAQSNVPASFADPRNTYEVNFWGTLNLLDALKITGFRGAFLYVSSADAYGLVPETALPIAEEIPLRPRNPYAVSKAAAEALCYQWSSTESMCITIARPFNHIGPGQSDQFVVSGLARQVAEIRLGRRAPIIEVGDIECHARLHRCARRGPRLFAHSRGGAQRRGLQRLFGTRAVGAVAPARSTGPCGNGCGSQGRSGAPAEG